MQYTCVWHRFYKNRRTANTPLFLLKEGISNGSPHHCGSSQSFNQCVKQMLLSAHSWEPASIHHMLVSTCIDMHIKHGRMHTHTHRVCFIKATNIYWVPVFCQLPEMYHLAYKPVCASINKGKQSLPLVSCLIVLKESTSSHLLLQQASGNAAELSQLALRMWKPKRAKRHIKTQPLVIYSTGGGGNNPDPH